MTHRHKTTQPQDSMTKKFQGTPKPQYVCSRSEKAIEQYENRLTEVSVSMTYLKSQKLIQIVVEGRLVETNAPYKYTTSINLWN